MGDRPAADETPAGAEYRRLLYTALHAASRDYDQAILTLAAGTLAVSVTFAHDITPTPVAGSRTLLLLAWGGLLVSMILTLVSFLTSQNALREAIEAHDHPERAKPGTSRWGGATSILNGAAGAALIAGLALLGWYALANS
ncbi:MAG: hypothetical protein ACHQ3P_01325 [Candidatus Limnocylindrales bacterium]